MTETNTHFLGEKINIKGVGRRWALSNYPVVIVDIREEDNSIKVKYADGGYKRFPLSQFQTLIIDSNATYKFQNYEMLGDQYDPTAEVVDNMAKKRLEIEAAVAKNDKTQEQKLRKELANITKSNEAWLDAKHQMIHALHKEDHDEAQRQKLKAEQHYKVLKQAGAEPNTVESKSILMKSLERALGGGMAGATAMIVQVCTFMWLRTTMNYQYRYGTSTTEALKILYKDGGIPRFYRGILPALFQGPLSRFGDTASNTGVLAFFNSSEATRNLPVFVKTSVASVAAGSFRIVLMPIDTVKTIMQVEGKDGIPKLMAKFRANGPSVFFHGSLAASAATIAGHFPFFATFNTLQENIPIPESDLQKMSRNGAIGFVSSIASDTVSNSIRVVKTYRQTHTDMISYPQAVKDVLAQDGMKGLFFRGLGTRLLTNGLQGMVFATMWKSFEPKIMAALGFDK